MFPFLLEHVHSRVNGTVSISDVETSVDWRLLAELLPIVDKEVVVELGPIGF